MLNRQQLTITAVANYLTNSTDFALTLVGAQETESLKEQQAEKKRSVPWKLLTVASGSVIAGVVAYMKSMEDLAPSGLEDSEDTGAVSDTENLAEESSDDGQSLLDKVVAWITSIDLGSKDSPSPPVTVPQAPALVSTDRGQAFLGSESAMTDSDSTTVSYITTAARTVGIDPELTFSVAKIESNLKVDAKNRITGATGLNQFIPSTWKFLIKKYPSLGFTESDIRDPQKNAIMGAVYLKQISGTLKKQLGRDPSVTEVYLGHFLGPSGALSFIRSLEKRPEAVAADLFPSAAKANPNIFFDGKRPRTLSQVFDLMSNKVSKATSAYRMLAQTVETPGSIVEAQRPSSTPTTRSVAVSALPTDSSVAVPKETSTFLSAKVTSRQTPTETRLGQVEHESVANTSVTSSSPPVQNKTYARTKHGTLVALAVP